MNFTLQMFVYGSIFRATLQQNITFELKKNSLNILKNIPKTVTLLCPQILNFISS